MLLFDLIFSDTQTLISKSKRPFCTLCWSFRSIALVARVETETQISLCGKMEEEDEEEEEEEEERIKHLQ